MSVIQFKIKYSDEKDIIRIVEIKTDNSFEQLHNLLLTSYGLKGKQLASFYTCDEEWNKIEEITLLDMSDDETKIPVMSKTKISDIINQPGQKLIYVFDFQDMWEFSLEVLMIKDKSENKIKYPLVIKSIGTLPKRNNGQGKLKLSDKSQDKVKILEETELLDNNGLEDEFSENPLYDADEDVGTGEFTDEEDY
ncbi:MAG: hypothetical protein A3H98_14645 [Bacteroidetes bacterium RIFCSPLOWO2_02_FULL_36_8]|nr:MAG: hypothetical protein A3H98_14645 [Bacteroidetes bacterium RIFCSPLOWO2_02_FULL_36_8]OFY72126.1 MAG: hypothetical protein A3G23_07130 [Bacteroidetes bacterium RIFCSPLOWO2_12_FULL_37_12]